MKSALFFVLLSFAYAGPAKKPAPKAPSLAPTCEVPGKAGSLTCPPIGSAEARMMKDAKAEDAPYTPPAPDRSGPRDLHCKITSDCPQGHFCGSNGMCGSRATSTSP